MADKALMKVSDITVFLSIFEAACKCSVCVLKKKQWKTSY
jgi:hypothetical protein